MSKVKQMIEKKFEHFAYFICNHRKKVLLIMFAIVIGIVSQISKLSVDTSFEGMLHVDDPKRLEYNKFRDQFGQDRVVLLTVKTPDVFDPTYLRKLKAFHQELEEAVPHLKEVRSLANARRTRGDGDTLVVEDLLEGWPEQPIDLAALKQFVLNNPVYLNDYISEDGRIAALIVEPLASIADPGADSDLMDGFEDDLAVTEEPVVQSKIHHFLSKKDNKEVVDAVSWISAKYRAPDFQISTAGGPVSEEVYDSHTKQTMRKFTLVMLGVIVIALFILFRRVTGAIYPMIIVYCSLLSTLGVMAMFGVPISVFSVVLPSFLTAVGIADSVHILAIFYREYQNGREKVDAIAYAIGHSGLAVLMTSMTTAAGLLSFSISELSSIGNLGIFAAVGVCLALVYTVIMLPAFLAITPIKVRKVKSVARTPKLMDKILIAIADFSSGSPKTITVACLVIFAISIGFMFQLKFSHNHKNIFPEEMTIRKDEDFIDKHLKGIASVEVVLDTQKENGLYDPELLKRLDTLSGEIKAIEDDGIYVGKVRNINDILRETNQALHENNAEFYRIPDDRELIAQELMLFENSGSDDLERVVDSRFSKTRISVKIPYMEVLLTEKISNDIYDRFTKMFAGMADITVTGMSPMMGTTVSAAIRSMSKSYVVAFFVISIMMILLVGDVKLGAISMIPNIFPIFFVMGIMGAFNVLVDLNALMIGSIAIGLVVDDTMHFMYNFRRYYEKSGDVHLAVRETFLSTGRALLITSLVLAANFFVLMFATFTSTHKFGFYTGFVVLMALVSDFILAPALMVLFVPYLKLKRADTPEPTLQPVRG
jgi:predicted RND superfamily exporter protein